MKFEVTEVKRSSTVTASKLDIQQPVINLQKSYDRSCGTGQMTAFNESRKYMAHTK